MAEINLESSQLIYYNSFVMDNVVGDSLYYEFYFAFEATPIYSSNVIVSYSFKPVLYWEAEGITIVDGYLYDMNGGIVSFIYTTDEIRDSFITGETLLNIDLYSEDQQFWFYFYDGINNVEVETDSLNLEDYNLYSFMNYETFSGPYMPSERLEYLTSLNNDLVRDYNELERVNEDLVIDFNTLQQDFDNLQASIDATNNNLFELIGDSFKPVFNTLNIELAPNITIGMVLCVPIVCGILSFILKETVK